MILLLTTEENKGKAISLSEKLLSQKLAACISIKEVSSLFLWKGSLEKENEFQLLIKTTINNLKPLMKYISKAHSYETPQLIYWEASCSDDYSKWLINSIDSN